ncbi:hypothetical protein O3P69_008065 [Scylla paramamosain]|uniref:Ig-like domain-containing protein n=1 Tax=Scylla paramamosain TaxID=85552 RepID=A0AAW0T0Z7_SCYPA
MSRVSAATQYRTSHGKLTTTLLCNLRVDTERHKRIYGTVACTVFLLSTITITATSNNQHVRQSRAPCASLCAVWSVTGLVLSCVVAALGVVMHDMRASLLVYDNNLVLQMVSRVSSGNYTCAATNTLTATFEEFIEPAPPRSQQATLAGRRSPATLHAASSPLPPPLPRFPFLPSYLRSSQLYISNMGDCIIWKEKK